MCCCSSRLPEASQPTPVLFDQDSASGTHCGGCPGFSARHSSAGYGEEHLHPPGCGQRDLGQVHAQVRHGPIYELWFKEPFLEYLQLVIEFSKKTRNYSSPPATDIQIPALTYPLEAEFIGVSLLKREPEKVKLCSSIQYPKSPLHISDFHRPSKPKPPQEAVTHEHQPVTLRT